MTSLDCGDVMADLEMLILQDVKHPILLHSEHHFTALIVNYCHKKVTHGSMKDTLAEL